MFFAFPWNAPHVHYNVWLNGRYVDPFASGDEAVSLWRKHNWPGPFRAGDDEDDSDEFTPTTFDEEAVAEVLAACRDRKLAAQLEAVEDPAMRAMDTIFHMNYFPTRFELHRSVYQEEHPRTPLLDLPFCAEDFVGIAHVDWDGPRPPPTPHPLVALCIAPPDTLAFSAPFSVPPRSGWRATS